jgi:hypothetical protein
MATYIVLASFTDQGIRKVKDSPKRADAFKEMAKKCGATVKDVFWTLGEYDIVSVVVNASPIMPWMWTLAFWHNENHTPTHGFAERARRPWWHSPRAGGGSEIHSPARGRFVVAKKRLRLFGGVM